MAQDIRTRRGKSAIQTRLEQERKASRKDPKGKKAFVKGIGTAASFVIPGGIATKATPVVKKGIEKTIRKVQAKRNVKKFLNEIEGDPAIRNFDQATKEGLKKIKEYDKYFLSTRKRDKKDIKSRLKYHKKSLKEDKISTYHKNEVAELKKNLKDASAKVRDQQAFMFKRYTIPTVKKVVKKTAGPVAGATTAAATYKSKRGGGLTNTVPPKRGPNPQGLKNGGCPFRENGAKSDIQGIKDIQVKGKKFTGIK